MQENESLAVAVDKNAPGRCRDNRIGRLTAMEEGENESIECLAYVREDEEEPVGCLAAAGPWSATCRGC